MSRRIITPLRQRQIQTVRELPVFSHESLENSFGSVMNEKRRLIPITESLPITKIEKKTLFIIDSICEILEKNYPFSDIRFMNDKNSYKKMMEKFNIEFPLKTIIEKYAKYIKVKDRTKTEDTSKVIIRADATPANQILPDNIPGEILYSYFLYFYFDSCEEIIKEHIDIYDKLLSKYSEIFINNQKIEEYNRLRFVDRMPGEGTNYYDKIVFVKDHINTYKKEMDNMKKKMELFKNATFEHITKDNIYKIQNLFTEGTEEIIKLDYMTTLFEKEYNFLGSVSKPFKIVLEVGKNRIYKKSFGPRKEYNLIRMVEEKIKVKESSGRGTKKNRKGRIRTIKLQKHRSRRNKTLKN